ncbi:MAG TPA: zinc ABC transporter substrate-binding protein [Anaerolineales bacterium]|nr:zinc ABC transporter substrate-binding protein [Anaerolineales bacterium]HNN11986.1 zinc ABC transporter substrate-binding protein [Anaerolineales bacterium]
MKKNFNTIIVTFIVAALFLTGCGSTAQSGERTFKVLASTTFLADIAQNIAGDRIHVDALLPTGADPHAYQAAPSDVSRIAESNVLILNGIEYEHFIEPLLENADGERLIITATEGLTPNEMESEETPGEMVGDPHMWLDVNRVITYVENIRDGLSEADPDGAETYKVNAEAYIAKLKGLDMWILQEVETIPAERRLLVTNHEAMGYFAQRYGFTVTDSILPSFSSEASVSAQEVAASIDTIMDSGAPAIFLGEVENTNLADQIASETGVKVVNTLYLESLTEGAPAPTYIDMMRYNVTEIVNALQ